MTLTLACRRAATTTVVDLAGDLDAHAAPDLRQLLMDAVTEGCPNVVVDLTKVTFVNSTGLGVLVGGMKRAATAGSAFSLVATNAQLLQALRITGLDRCFTVYPSRDQALRRLP